MAYFVQIRFVTTGDLISELIRLQTWSSWSHVEFILDDGTTLGAHAKGGVLIRPIDYDKFTAEKRYSIDVGSFDVKKAIMDYAHSQIGKPYDFSDIMGMLARRDWRKEDHWICSELVAACFEKGGFPLLHAGQMVNRISPRDLYLSPYLNDAKTLDTTPQATIS